MKVIIFNKKLLFLILATVFIIFLLVVLFSSHLFLNNSTVTSAQVISQEELSEKLRNLTNSSNNTAKNSNSNNNDGTTNNNNTNNDSKVAYLTFDDGPSPSATPMVLDILKEENVLASFFVVGKSVTKYPDLVKRAYQEGHYIANHGYSHNNEKLYKSDYDFLQEIKNTDTAIANAINVENYCSYIFRFPNGYMSNIYKAQKEHAVELLSSIGYSYIDWNCLNNDSMQKYSSAQLVNNLKKSIGSKQNLVILMHDTTDVSNSSLALKDSISLLRNEGYTFKNFYDLFE